MVFIFTKSKENEALNCVHEEGNPYNESVSVRSEKLQIIKSIKQREINVTVIDQQFIDYI